MIGSQMTKRFVAYVPHPDDETLSMWPLMNYLAAGYTGVFVFISRGPVTAASLRLDGAAVCSWADHNYSHDPATEQYVLPTAEEIGLARLHEGMSAVGAMGMVPPTTAGEPGEVICHEENLPTNFGNGGGGSSTGTPLPEAIDTVEAIIRKYIDIYPNSLHFTMSPTDAHVDHASCGLALRRLKGTPVANWSKTNQVYTGGDPVLGPLLSNAAFFVSKLYWSTAAGQPGSRMGEKCGWYPNIYPDNYMIPPRRDEYTAWLRTKVLKAYTAWCPAAGQFAIGGGHSVPTQFANCFGPSLPYVSALWHM